MHRLFYKTRLGQSSWLEARFDPVLIRETGTYS